MPNQQPIQQQPPTNQLLKILDGIGSESDVRKLLIGSTLQSHLKALQLRNRV